MGLLQARLEAHRQQQRQQDAEVSSKAAWCQQHQELLLLLIMPNTCNTIMLHQLDCYAMVLVQARLEAHRQQQRQQDAEVSSKAAWCQQHRDALHRKIGNRRDPLQVLLALGEQLSSEPGTSLNAKVHTLLATAAWSMHVGSKPALTQQIGNRREPLQVLLALGEQITSEPGTSLNAKVPTLLVDAASQSTAALC